MDPLVVIFASEKAQAIYGGAAGGLVAGLTLKEPPKEVVRRMVIGPICSYAFGGSALAIVSPILSKFIDAPTLNVFAACAIVGIGGPSVVQLILDVYRIRRNSINSNGVSGK